MLKEFSNTLRKNYRILPILFQKLRASSQVSENTELGITEWFSPSLMIQYSLPESDTVEKLTSTDHFLAPQNDFEPHGQTRAQLTGTGPLGMIIGRLCFLEILSRGCALVLLSWKVW